MDSRNKILYFSAAAIIFILLLLFGIFDGSVFYTVFENIYAFFRTATAVGVVIAIAVVIASTLRVTPPGNLRASEIVSHSSPVTTIADGNGEHNSTSEPFDVTGQSLTSNSYPDHPRQAIVESSLAASDSDNASDSPVSETPHPEEDPDFDITGEAEDSPDQADKCDVPGYVSSPKQQIDLLLIGKTGQGKSATANSIVRRKAFHTSHGAESHTLDVSRAYTEYQDYTIMVVDGPGVAENRFGKDKATQKANKDMAEAMSLCPNGFHCLLMVIKFGGRFTEEEQECIEMLKKMFGKNIIKEYCIFIVTHGELFDMEEDIGTFEEWLLSQKGALTDLFQECKYRCILFRNKSKNPAVLENQLNELIQMIHALRNRDVRYTNDLFEQMKKNRDALEVEAKMPQLKEKVLRETDLIMADLNKIKNVQLDSHDNEPALLELESKIDTLLQGITEEDRNTGALDSLKDNVLSVKENIKLQKAMNAQRKEDQKHQEEMKRQHEKQIQEMQLENKKEQNKLQAAMENAGKEEREELFKKLDSVNAAAQENINKMNKKFEEERKKAKKDEEKKIADALETINRNHERDMERLRQTYDDMNKANKEVMKKEIQALKETIEQLQAKPPRKDPNKVRIKVRDQQNRVVDVEIDPDSPMGQVFRAYCNQYGGDTAGLRFLFDEVVVTPDRTPNDLELEDGDLIEVVQGQVGGCNV